MLVLKEQWGWQWSGGAGLTILVSKMRTPGGEGAQMLIDLYKVPDLISDFPEL